MCSITIEHGFLSFLLWFLKCILLKIGSFFSKNKIKDKGKKNRGSSPHPPGRPSAFCLFAVLLAGHDRGDRPVQWRSQKEVRQLESVCFWYQDNMQYVLHEPKHTQHAWWVAAYFPNHEFGKTVSTSEVKSHLMYVAVDGRFELAQIFIDIIWYHFFQAANVI